MTVGECHVSFYLSFFHYSRLQHNKESYSPS